MKFKYGMHSLDRYTKRLEKVGKNQITTNLYVTMLKATQAVEELTQEWHFVCLLVYLLFLRQFFTM